MSGLSSANDSGMYQPNLRKETEIWPHYFTQQNILSNTYYAKNARVMSDSVYSVFLANNEHARYFSG